VNYELDTHEAIVEAAAPSFLMRQKQTEDTHFMTSPLFDDLGYLVDYPAADDIIEGRYNPPPGTDPDACEFIEVLAMPASIRAKGPVNCIATVAEHRGATLLAEKPIQEEENTAAAATSFASSASSPIRKLSMHDSQTGPFTLVAPITNQNSFLRGSSGDRLEVFLDE